MAMLLLDRNNEPTCTVYYIAAALYQYLADNPGVDVGQLYEVLTSKLVKKDVNFEFMVLALDFLFLLNRAVADEAGGIYVH